MKMRFKKAIDELGYYALRESNQRNYARILDHFPVTYRPLSSPLREIKKKEFKLVPTSERPPSSLSVLLTPLSFAKLTVSRLSGFDPGMADILKDIYERLSSFQPPREVTAPPKEKEEESGVFHGVCADISGMGMRMVTRQKVSKGEFIEIMIAPPMASVPFAIQAVGEVKRSVTVNRGEGKMCYAGIFFYGINNDDREEITQYTFQAQRRLLRLRKQMVDDAYENQKG